MALAQDAIDKAIAAAAALPPQQPAAPAMTEFGFQMAPNGRPAALAVPHDITDEEWLNLIGGLIQVVGQMRAQRPTSRITLPRGVRRG